MYRHHFGFSFVYHLSLTESKSCFPVQKNWGISSELQVFGKVGFWGRKMTRLSLQLLKQIVPLNYLGFHLKTLKKISSAFSAPLHPPKSRCTWVTEWPVHSIQWANKKFFPVLPGPLIRMFPKFSLTFSSMFFMACEKTFCNTPFHLRIWLTDCSHYPSHWAKQGFSKVFSKSSSLVSLLRSITWLIFSISHEVAMNYFRHPDASVEHNCARSVFPLTF